MKRQLTIAIVAAVLSIASLALIFGLWWLVSLVMNDFFPRLLHSSLQANFSILAIMLMMVAALGAWLTSIIARREQLRRPKPRHTHPHPHLHLRFRH